MSNSPLPNFLIVGAAKSGTTSLHAWLSQHPEVFMPKIKEPSYFVHGYGISDWDSYTKLFEPGKGKLAIGEASVAYLWTPESASWIHDRLGDDVKIIIILRNPVQTAISEYVWMVMEGYEWLGTMEKALQAEYDRLKDPSFCLNTLHTEFRSYLYFHSFLYYEQVKRYMNHFKPNMIQVCLFDELVENPKGLYQNICTFLGISKDFEPSSYTPQNLSRMPRFPTLQYNSKMLPCSIRLFSSRLRPLLEILATWLMDCNKLLGYKYRASSSLKAQLKERYHDDILKLSELIQQDLSIWLM